MTDDEVAPLYAQLRELAAQSERAERLSRELAAALDALVAIFTLRGELEPGHLRQLERVRARIAAATTPTVTLDVTDDKYAMSGADIDLRQPDRAVPRPGAAPTTSRCPNKICARAS
jgi:hypothetical protein